jgi:preprotein translocase subunit SecE
MADKEKKPGVVERFKRWNREMKSELKKVVWPTRSQTVNNTLVVLACVVIVGVFIWGFDWLAASAAKALISVAKG